MEYFGYKAFNEDMTNKYGVPFEVGKEYHNEKPVHFGPKGHGFHLSFCMEDVFCFFNPKKKIKICSVIGSGKIAFPPQKDLETAEMGVVEHLYIKSILDREEVIAYAQKLSPERLKKFLHLCSLTEEEINLFYSFCQNQALYKNLIEDIENWQTGNVNTFQRDREYLKHL